MRGLKDFTDEECGQTDQAWERLEALVVMIGVGLNMASKMGPNVRCRSLMAILKYGNNTAHSYY